MSTTITTFEAMTSFPAGDVTTRTVDQVCFLTDSRHDSVVQQSYNVYLGSTMFFVLAGLVGNCLSVRVFSSDEMRSFSSNVYLLMLAVSDSFYLISVFLTKILTTVRCLHFPEARFDLVNRSSFWCKLLQYLTDFFSDYSTCLILAFTVERCIAAYLPMQFKKLCTAWRARITCAALFIAIAVFIAPYHIMWVHWYPEPHEACLVLRDHEEAFTAFYLTESFLFRIGPVFAIATLNVFIVIKVWRIKRHRKLMSGSNFKCVVDKRPLTSSSSRTMTSQSNPVFESHQKRRLLSVEASDNEITSCSCGDDVMKSRDDGDVTELRPYPATTPVTSRRSSHGTPAVFDKTSNIDGDVLVSKQQRSLLSVPDSSVTVRGDEGPSARNKPRSRSISKVVKREDKSLEP